MSVGGPPNELSSLQDKFCLGFESVQKLIYIQVFRAVVEIALHPVAERPIPVLGDVLLADEGTYNTP
jgi:hypothetical protein